MRKTLKNGAMTERAITMMVNKINKLITTQHSDARKELQSTNNWKDIYPTERI